MKKITVTEEFRKELCHKLRIKAEGAQIKWYDKYDAFEWAKLEELMADVNAEVIAVIEEMILLENVKPSKIKKAIAKITAPKKVDADKAVNVSVADTDSDKTE